ncbi:extracellular solute-binding protein [Niallia taxi]|uniref:Extracellular solute-binding protein n=1 Tax=Niallia taxi TaxID=2499688 RepID=A0A3S2W7H7_9BACI|nr:extracellular solute-binding protein [Niallia taxi]MCM3217853.1 extracellular solute-binding protein [Niallia taxi]MDK8638938.1 extracellular solute-binding protein [Niallia taxi]MED4036744.1 extracellular solute-binding protein [Niallia taxi]MED4053440.1 extracellular solute-binding protein [Niallia taxi]MED4119280.1 extracellular solute-binding protein [Niallia taxi]
MRRKSIFVMMSIVMIVVLALAGCSSSTNESASSDGKTVIKFMHLWPEGSSKAQYTIVNNIIKQYEKDHPDIKIQTEILGNEQYKDKIKVLSASNELPDVGVTWAAGYLKPFVEGNMLAPLDDKIESDFKDSFVAGTTEAYAVDGKTYGLPLELNITPVYYNKEIFEKYNLEIPETYDQFVEVVKTLVDKGVTPITLGNKDRWTGSMWYMYLADRIGGSEALANAINRSGSFEDPALLKAAEEVKKLVDMGAFVKGFNGLSNDEAKGYFMNEQAAMYLMATWELPNYTTSPDVTQEFKDKVGYFKFPTYEGGKGDINSYVGGPGVGLFVSENSKVKDESKDFVSYLVKEWGKRSVSDAGVIPATVVDTSSTELDQMYIDILNDLGSASNLTLYADVQMSSSVAQVHLDMIQSLFGGQATPKDFVKKQEEALSEEE